MRFEWLVPPGQKLWLVRFLSSFLQLFAMVRLTVIRMMENVKKETIRRWIVNESSDSNLWKRLLLCRLLGKHSVIGINEEAYGRC